MNDPSKLIILIEDVWTGNTYKHCIIFDRNIDIISYPMVISQSIIQNETCSNHRAITE